jgi:hypothetical protein
VELLQEEAKFAAKGLVDDSRISSFTSTRIPKVLDWKSKSSSTGAHGNLTVARLESAMQAKWRSHNFVE